MTDDINKFLKTNICFPSKIKNYKGIQRPRCSDGNGCSACWHKYNSITPEQRSSMRAGYKTSSIYAGFKVGRLTVVKLDHINNLYEKYWLCECTCGKKKIIPQRCLTRKIVTVSCGCLKGEKKTGIYISKKEGWTIAARRVFKPYRDGDLTFDDFVAMSQMPCVYCGTSRSNNFNPYITNDGKLRNNQRVTPQRVSETWWKYNGLDRIDSSLPHLKSNCVPCCKKCNYMKLDYSREEFIEHCKKIIRYGSNQ